VTPAQRVAAVLGAAALAVPVIATFEGYVPKGYVDPAPGKFETICYGHMEKGVLGKTYSPEKCTELLAGDAITHGIEISHCLPDTLPTETRAAFTSAAFNLGAAQFCRSSMSRKALAGDLPGACASLSLYVFAGGNRLNGLVRRRAAERALCEKGLKP
jgi:lysozyme